MLLHIIIQYIIPITKTKNVRKLFLTTQKSSKLLRIVLHQKNVVSIICFKFQISIYYFKQMKKSILTCYNCLKFKNLKAVNCHEHGKL